MKRLNDAPAGNAGFTLIEVLIAMVILSVGLLALEGMAVGASRTTAHASRRSLYTTVATDALEQTISGLHAGAVANSTTPVKNSAGVTVANSAVTIVDNGALTAPSPPLHRYDITVQVTPVQASESSDAVTLVSSVIQ